MKKPIIIIIMILVTIKTGYSQYSRDSIRLPLSIQTFEIAKDLVPLLESENPVAVSLLNIKGLCFAEAGYFNERKDIRYTHQPGITSSYFVKTSGYKKIMNTSFYGSFGYRNETYEDVLYNSTLVFDSWNPYLIADTIGGRQTLEAFDFEGNVSFKLSDHFLVGGKIEYTTAEGAKHKDPRNLNKISGLKIIPGILYHNNKLSIGINASYFNNTNSVDIDVIGPGKYTIFKFMGLGYYAVESNVTSYSSCYYTNGYSVASQIVYRGEKTESFLDFSVKFGNEESRYGNYYRYLDGIAKTEDYSLKYRLDLRTNNAIHSFALNSNISYIYGDFPVYQTNKYTINGYNFFEYELVRNIPNTIIIAQRSAGISYKYSTFRQSGMRDMEVEAGVRYEFFKDGKYPVNEAGFFNSTNICLNTGVRKTFGEKNYLITPSLGLYARMNLASEMEYRSGTSIRLLPDIITKNYDSMRATIYGVSCSIDIEKPLEEKFVNSIYFKPSVTYVFSPDLSNATGSNLIARAALGFTF